MSEEFVGRNEFNNLKEEVQELKIEINEYKGILTKIDKKIDIIAEKINNGEKMDELKLQPLEKRVAKLEENHIWLSRTVLATIIGILIKILFEVSKIINI